MAPVEGHHVPERVTGRASIQFGPVWYADGKFGLIARCDQFMIVAAGAGVSGNRKHDCMIQDDDDDEVASPAGINAKPAPEIYVREAKVRNGMFDETWMAGINRRLVCYRA
ncbi:hypothetical protein T492DRAFT_868179 [Pavlovales sp. CCMP2436]|nr:hypothetical protein T492DRAFT_868179 [Pavlovales sp. CCMP2436]